MAFGSQTVTCLAPVPFLMSLKEVVDEVYAYGNYVLRYNDERLKGYRSIYLRRLRSKQTSEPDPAVPEAPVTPPVQTVS